jgi:hypothetical protein
VAVDQQIVVRVSAISDCDILILRQAKIRDWSVAFPTLLADSFCRQVALIPASCFIAWASESRMIT